MVRRRVVAVLALALAGVGLVVAVVGVVLAVVTPAGPVYTVAQVATGLAYNPQVWIGRTVTVRGTLAVVVDDDSVDPGGGVGRSYCWPVGRCEMGLPTDVPLHIFLLGPTPRRVPAYAGMLAALLAARSPSIASGPLTLGMPVQVWRTAPPVLVVLVRPRRVQPAWERLSHMAQQAASNLPAGSWTTLAQLPLVGPLFGQLLMPGTVHGGAPRTYRIRLLPPVPAARRAGCPLVCDDAVLLDSP